MTIKITELNDSNAEKLISAYLDHVDNGTELPTVDYQVGYDYESNNLFHDRCYKSAKALRPNAIFKDMWITLPF
jgi:hypothetical protein